MKFTNLSSLLLVALCSGITAERLRGASSRNLQPDLVGDAGVVGCVTVTGPDGPRTVAPCTETAAPATGAGDMTESKDDEDDKEDDKKSEDDAPMAGLVGVEDGEEDEDKDDNEDDEDDMTSPGSNPSTSGLVGSENGVSSSGNTPDIVGLAVGTPELDKLYKLVVTAGLADVLRSDGPFTVFAPVNSAFPSGLDFLSFQANTPTAALQSVLTYHVVPGVAIRSTDLMDGEVVSTVQGGNITVSLTMDGAMINNSTVLAADIEASNGIVHLIDYVLSPM